MDGPFAGHDGPYGAPALAPPARVAEAWIDYNGHMNVGYYGVACDASVQPIWDGLLGLGESLVKGAGQGPYILQSHMHFLRELLVGDAFQVGMLLLDADAKRAHFSLQMRRLPCGSLAAVGEQVAVNVDLATRRSHPFPAWGQRRLARMLAEHAAHPRPPQIGRGIGLGRS